MPLSENRKSQLNILAFTEIETVWPKFTHGVPMIYGDYETQNDNEGEAYHVYEVEPYPMEKKYRIKISSKYYRMYANA